MLICTPDAFTRYFEQLTGEATAASGSYPETIVVGPTIRDRLARAA